MRIFLTVCWVSIASAAKRKREDLPRIAFNPNVAQQLVPNAVIGVLTTVPNKFIHEADYLLILLGRNKMFSPAVYLLDIQKRFLKSTVNLIDVMAWYSEIREPVFDVPLWFHSLVIKHDNDTTDEILRLVLAWHVIEPTDPDFWERRIEIWRQFCIGSCLSDRNITPESWDEYLRMYRKKLSVRNAAYSKSLSFKIHLPQQYLLEADYIATMLMQNYPFNSQAYRDKLLEWMPTTTTTLEDVQAIAQLFLQFTAVPRWFHELLMANKALNSDDLTDVIVALAHPGYTDATSVSQQASIWRHYCISSPASCEDMGDTWTLTAPGRNRYLSQYRQKIAKTLARNLKHVTEKTLLRKQISELPITPPAKELFAFVKDKLPNSYIGLTNVRNFVKRIKCQLHAPKWFHELLLAHPDKSVDQIVAMVADSNTSWTNRRPDSVKESVEIWREYVIGQGEESFVPSELQSVLREEPIYRLNPEVTKRLLQNYDYLE